METSLVRKRMPASALFDPQDRRSGDRGLFRKLDPRTLVKNPVMFVTGDRRAPRRPSS